MKQTDALRNEGTGSLLIVTKAFMDSLLETQNKILAFLKNSSDKTLVGDYISEADAQKVLGRKTTWFWDMRKKGLLTYAKVGNKVFYSRKDLEALLESSKINQNNLNA